MLGELQLLFTVRIYDGHQRCHKETCGHLRTNCVDPRVKPAITQSAGPCGRTCAQSSRGKTPNIYIR